MVFNLLSIGNLTEEEFIVLLGKPEIGEVRRRDGRCLESGMPEYIVRQTSQLNQLQNSAPTIKIIDFGQSFPSTAVLQILHISLSVRVPEVLFKNNIDYRIDLWSMGCMVGKQPQ